jgi:hypothetical protein
LTVNRENQTKKSLEENLMKKSINIGVGKGNDA